MDANDRARIRDDLARTLLETDPEYSAGEITEIVGVDEDFARRLWRAMGLPDTGDGKAFGDPDIGALEIVAEALRYGVFDDETLMRLTRAMGNTLARLADWQTSTLAVEIDRRVQDGEFHSRLEGALALARTVTPAFDGLLLYVWRRHLAAAVLRLETSADDNDHELLTTEQTVGFADLVRFTALSNRIGDTRLGDLVEEFETVATEVITATGSRSVKSLGDGILYLAPTPITGVETALQIIEQFRRTSTLPDVRVGIATGQLINRLGDVFGPPVNLAARLTSVARRNRVIVDEATAGRLGEGYETRALPARPLAGFGNIEPITVRRPWAYTG